MPKVRRDTYIDRGPEVMDFLKASTPVRFKWVPDYADYLPEQPGGRPAGRSVEPVPMDARFLGDELSRLHPPYTKAPANLIVTQADFRKLSLGLRTIKGPLTMVKVMLKRLWAMATGKKMYAMGNAIAIGLRKGLEDADVVVEYEAELKELLIESDRVVGVVVEQGGEHARSGRPWRHPRLGRLRAQPGAAREVPPPADLVSGRPALRRTPAAAYWPGPPSAPRPTCSMTPGGVRPFHCRAVRGSAWPSATCPARSSSTPPASAT